MDAAEERRFREFVAARSPALMRLGFLLTGGDQHAAEDLLQAALAKLVTGWHRVDSPEAYVRQIMYRQQISWWRLGRNRRESVWPALPETPVESGAGGVELRMVLRAALTRLAPRQRAVLVLRYFEDLPDHEVARILGISVGTVRSTAHRSLARLREIAPELAEMTLEMEAVR